MSAEHDPYSEIRFVLAFYGVERSAKAVECFFNLARDWFTQLNLSPDLLGVSGKTFGGKLGNFRRGLSKIEQTGFSQVDSFEMDVSLPKVKNGGVLYSAAAGFSKHPRLGGHAILALESRYAAKEIWRTNARRIIECVRPAYGIGFELPLRRGPIYYALGVNFSRISEFEVATGDEGERRRSISFWPDARKEEVYRQGLLRNVYRWNFLTQPQLDRPVEGATLAEWIKADPQRGALELLAGDIWLWEVEESKRDSIRDRLHDADAIFDWRKYWGIEPDKKTALPFSRATRGKKRFAATVQSIR